MDPQSSAEWIIHQISQESVLQHPASQLPAEQLRLLSSHPGDVTDADRPLLLLTNNNAVALIRSAIERRKKAGASTVKVRRGLRLPNEWEAHYETVYQSNFPWFVSSVIQNAFLGNAPAGERHPWTSR